MIVENATLGPLGTLRFELRNVLAACASERCAPEIGAKLEALLDAPQWEAAADESNTLRAQLAHWKAFAVHAEGEHAAWKKTATEMDAELRKLRADLDDYLRHVIDMAQGEHYLDVVRLNAEALLKRIELVLGPNARLSGAGTASA